MPYQYGWWTVDVKEATGKIKWVVKARNKENAIKQIKKWAKEHTDEVRRIRPDFETEVFWDTFELDRIGYQRLFK